MKPHILYNSCTEFQLKVHNFYSKLLTKITCYVCHTAYSENSTYTYSYFLLNSNNITEFLNKSQFYSYTKHIPK